MVMDEYNRCYWFNNNEINIQLRKKSQGTYHVFQLESLNVTKEIISEMCEKLKDHNGAAVLSINYSSEKNDRLSHCPLWAGLAIIQAKDNIQKAFFIDPFDYFRYNFNKIFDLKIALLEKGFDNIKYISYWNNDKLYDCGPLIIIHLDYLARTGRSLDNVGEREITDLRSDVQNNYRMRNINKHQPSDLEISNQLIRKVKVIDMDKQEDIKILKKILKLISNRIDLKSTLLEIGKLCEEISLNENDENSIRMKFGFSKRLADHENNNRINFDKFCQLKAYIENESSLLSQSDLGKIENYLSSLKKKILFILKENLVFVNENEIIREIESLNEIDLLESNEFVSIVDRYQSEFVVSKIKTELNMTRGINYNNVEDRYVFFRVLTIIGNLSNQLDHSVFPSLKLCFKIRNKIIHCHKKIKENSKNDTLNNEKIHAIFNCIKQYLVDRGENTDLCTKLKSLFNYIKKRDNKPIKETSLKNIDYKDKLDDFIRKAHKLIKRNPNEDLRKLDESYQLQLGSLNIKDKRRFPENLINKINILEYIKKFPIKQNFDITENLLNQNILKRNIINYKISDIKNEIDYLKQIQLSNSITTDKKSYIIGHIICVVTQYVRDLSDIDISSFELPSKWVKPTYIPFDAEFIKICISETNEYQSIDYLYTLPHIEYCPIIALLLFNVGVSFAKLSLYDSAIEYLEMASENINVFIENSIHSDQTIIRNLGQHQKVTNNFYLAVLGIDPYELLIKRTLAKVLHLANKNDYSLKEFNDVHQTIQLKNFYLADKFLKIEIIKFYIDYSYLLIDSHKYNEAIEIAEIVYKLDKENIININNLLKSSYKINQYKTREKLENILKEFPDENLKFEILASFVIVCFTDQNSKQGNANAKENFLRLKNFIKEDNEKMFDKFNLLNLQIVFIEALGLLNSQNLSIDDLRIYEQAAAIFNNIKLYKNHLIFKLSYLNFFWIYIQFEKVISEENGKKYCIEQANFYFEKIIGTELLKIQHMKLKTKFIEIFIDFLSVYIKHAIVGSEDSYVKLLKNLNYFLKFLQHQDISKCLLLIYGIRAHKFLLLNLNNAFNYLDEAIKTLDYLVKLPKVNIQLFTREIEWMFSHLSMMVLENVDRNNNVEFTIESLMLYQGLFNYFKPFIKVDEVLINLGHYDITISPYVSILENILEIEDFVEIDESNQEFIEICNKRFDIHLNIENRILRLENIQQDIKRAMKKELNSLKRCYAILLLISES